MLLSTSLALQMLYCCLSIGFWGAVSPQYPLSTSSFRPSWCNSGALCKPDTHEGSPLQLTDPIASGTLVSKPLENGLFILIWCHYNARTLAQTLGQQMWHSHGALDPPHRHSRPIPPSMRICLRLGGDEHEEGSPLHPEKIEVGAARLVAETAVRVEPPLKAAVVLVDRWVLKYMQCSRF